MDLCGEEPRRLLSYIRATIEEITTDFAKLEFNEMVPVPATNRFIEYQDLIAAEKAGEKEIFVRELKKRIPIAHLLDGVEDAIMREEVSHIPVNVFISYSHNDIEHLGALRAALSPLERLNKLRIWDNRDIDAGLEWEKEIFRELAEADIVLCLVSADFIGSEFCYSRELAVALEAHLAGSKVVVPVRLRKCAWESLPIATLRSTPTNDWVTSRTNKDEVWTEVAHYLEPLASQIKEEKIKKKEERDR